MTRSLLEKYVIKGPSIKYVTLFLMIFDPPPVTNCHKSWTPLKVCHTSEQKVNKQVSRIETALNNYSTKRIKEKASFALDCEIIALVGSSMNGVPCILLAKSRAVSKN